MVILSFGGIESDDDRIVAVLVVVVDIPDIHMVMEFIYQYFMKKLFGYKY